MKVVKKGKELDYVNQRIDDVFDKIRDLRVESYSNKAYQRVRNYLVNIWDKGNIEDILYAEANIKNILDQIDEPVQNLSTAIAGKQEEKDKKTLISSLEEYRPVRKKLSYEEIKERYFGPKKGSIRGLQLIMLAQCFKFKLIQKRM